MHYNEPPDNVKNDTILTNVKKNQKGVKLKPLAR